MYSPAHCYPLEIPQLLFALVDKASELAKQFGLHMDRCVSPSRERCFRSSNGGINILSACLVHIGDKLFRGRVIELKGFLGLGFNKL